MQMSWAGKAVSKAVCRSVNVGRRRAFIVFGEYGSKSGTTEIRAAFNALIGTSTLC